MMYRATLRLIAAAILLGLAGAPATSAEDRAAEDRAAEDQAAKKIHWFHSLAKAQEAAKKQNKILFVDFFSIRCPPCRVISAQVFPNPAFEKVAAKSLVCTKIDVDKDQPSAFKYRIEVLPTFMFFTPSGEKIARFNGGEAFYTPDRAVKTIEQILADERSLAQLEKQVQASPGNPETTLRLAMAMINARSESIERTEKLLAAVERADTSKTDKNVVTRKETIKRAYDELTMARVNRINDLIRVEKNAEAIKEIKALVATKYVPAELKEQAPNIIKKLDTTKTSGK